MPAINKLSPKYQGIPAIQKLAKQKDNAVQLAKVKGEELSAATSPLRAAYHGAIMLPAAVVGGYIDKRSPKMPLGKDGIPMSVGVATTAALIGGVTGYTELIYAAWAMLCPHAAEFGAGIAEKQAAKNKPQTDETVE